MSGNSVTLSTHVPQVTDDWSCGCSWASFTFIQANAHKYHVGIDFILPSASKTVLRARIFTIEPCLPMTPATATHPALPTTLRPHHDSFSFAFSAICCPLACASLARSAALSATPCPSTFAFSASARSLPPLLCGLCQLLHLYSPTPQAHSPPVIPIPVALRQLRIEVDKVAGEEKVIFRRDGQAVAHESGRVDGESSRHLARDTRIASTFGS